MTLAFDHLTSTYRGARARIEASCIARQRAIAERIKAEAAEAAALVAEKTRAEWERVAREREVVVVARVSAVMDAAPWRKILVEVAGAHRLTAADLTGPSRISIIVAARQEAMFRMRFEIIDRDGKPISLPQIGRRLGNRDHTTVLHGIRQHMRRLDGTKSDCGPVLILRTLRERAPEFVSVRALSFLAEISERQVLDIILVLRCVIGSEEIVGSNSGAGFAIQAREAAAC